MGSGGRRAIDESSRFSARRVVSLKKLRPVGRAVRLSRSDPVPNNVQARVKWFNGMKGFGFVAPVDGSPDAFLHVSVLSQAGYGDLPDGTELTCDIVEGPRGPQVQRIIDVVGVEPGAAAPPPRSGFGERSGGYGERSGGYGERSGGYGERSGGYGDRPRFGGGAGAGAGAGRPQGERSSYGGSSGGAAASGPIATPAEGETIAGTVKWFKPESGFGFIVADDGGKDVFIHKSVLRRCGMMDLQSQQRVKMTVHMAQKGREATWIAEG